MATSFARLRPAALQPPRAAGSDSQRSSVPHASAAAGSLRLAAQAVRPAASRSRLLRRSAHRRGRRRAHRIEDASTSASTSPPRTAPPVYATASGTVVWEPERPETIAVRSDDGRVFAYWHIVPAVHNGQHACAPTGRCSAISQGLGSRAPRRTRRRALREPAAAWRDSRPTKTRRGRRCTRSASSAEGRALGASRLASRFDLVAEAWDETPMAVPGKWASKPVMPAVVRWRIRSGREEATPWRTAIDFTATIPPPSMFDAVFAPWTRQNHPWRSGRYRVLARRGTGTADRSADGRHTLDVEAIDTRGNRGRSSTVFSIAN